MDSPIPRGGAVALLVGLAASLTGPTPRALACASCGCGDPSITQMGQGLPFEGRLRASLGLRHLSYAIGRPDVDRVEVAEQRADLAVAWSPTVDVTLSVAVPLARRDVKYANLSRDVTWDLGDVDLRGRVVLYRDPAFAPDHLLSLLAGAELPTTIPLHGADGELKPVDAHPGTGSFDPMVGLSYAYLRDRGGLFASATFRYQTRGIGGLRNGPGGLVTVQGSWQPLRVLGLRLGLDARLDGQPDVNGQPLDEGRGFVLYASPGVAVAPTPDWVLTGTVRIPIVLALEGEHEEGLIAELGVVHDF